MCSSDLHMGEGRVAQFLSDQGWLWARGYDGGGPQMELLRRLAHWLMKEPELEENDLRVAVNASPAQVGNPHFVETVRQALAESGLAGDRLVIELSEAALLRDPRAIAQTLEALRTLGVQACVDDFGAGLATLASLRGLPIGEIKIDRSFVHALPGTPEDRMAVETVLRLASRMGLRTTAVGVENAAQWAWLREQGCDAAQGWLVGKPVEAHELVATIAALRRARGQFAESVRV